MNGGQFVIISGAKRMLKWPADNLDVHILVSFHGKNKEHTWPLLTITPLDATPVFGDRLTPWDKENYWLDYVRCEGNEDSLFACQHSGIGRHSCGPGKSARVNCMFTFNLSSESVYK